MNLVYLCREVAESIPGTTVLPGGGIMFTRRGFPAKVEFPSAGTDFLFDIGDRVGASIQVAPAGIWHDVRGWFGVHDLQVGDPDFDDDFDIRTSNDPFAMKILSPEVRGLLRSAALEGRMFWRVSRAGFLLRISRHPERRSELERWLSVALQLLDAVPNLEEIVDIAPVQMKVSADTACQVCGGSLTEGIVVECAKCATAHHKECWIFNERCSTFGCGWLGFR